MILPDWILKRKISETEIVYENEELDWYEVSRLAFHTGNMIHWHGYYEGKLVKSFIEFQPDDPDDPTPSPLAA